MLFDVTSRRIINQYRRSNLRNSQQSTFAVRHRRSTSTFAVHHRARHPLISVLHSQLCRCTPHRVVPFDPLQVQSRACARSLCLPSAQCFRRSFACHRRPCACTQHHVMQLTGSSVVVRGVFVRVVCVVHQCSACCSMYPSCACTCKHSMPCRRCHRLPLGVRWQVGRKGIVQ